MTATAMPLASVWVMIFLTSPSMAAPLGIVCETTATGRQQAAKNTVKSGTLCRVAIGEQSFQRSTLAVASSGTLRRLFNVYADFRTQGERPPLKPIMTSFGYRF